MEKISTSTPDLTAENVDRLLELFPQCATEIESDKLDKNGNPIIERAVDFDVLRDLLGDVAEGQRERYQFTWPGKAEARAEARRSIDKTMIPCPEKSVNWDTTKNLYIEGDNLDALKILRETYAGKIKLIYIDPPYNTGHDFIYDDDFTKSRADYDAESGEYDEEGGRLVANPESNGRFHSDWCSMMYPRLLLARDLLAPDGALFISLDDNEEPNARKICDEIFGVSNFVSELTVQINPRGRNLDKYIAKTTESILIYVKDYSNTACLNSVDKDERMLSEYNREDSHGRYRSIGLRNRNQSFNPATRPNLYFPLYIDPSSGSVSTEKDDLHTIERLPLASDGTPTCWTWSKQKIEEENHLIFGEKGGEGWRVYRKDYLVEGESSKTLAKSLQIDPLFNNDYGKRRIKELFGANVMSFPKPPALMRLIVSIGSNSNDLVMDFFSGSATFADAILSENYASNSNRRFILIQLPEPCRVGSIAHDAGLETIADIGEERIRRAGAKITAEIEEQNKQPKLGEEPKSIPDIGFRVLRIDSSNFKDTYSDPNSTKQTSLLDLVDNVKDGRSPLDLLFQVLPKFRIPYSADIVEIDLAGKTGYLVENGLLVACFDTDITSATIEAMAKFRPSYAVVRDLSFKDDSSAANFEEIFKSISPDTVRHVI